MVKRLKQNDALYAQLLGKVKDMSNFIPKPDTGTLFKNSFKTKDNHPDYIGTYATADGTVREFAAWINNSGIYKDYLTIRFSDRYDSTNKKSA